MTLIDDRPGDLDGRDQPTQPSAEPAVGVPGMVEFGDLRGAERDAAFMAVEVEIRRLQAVQAAMLTEVTRSGSFLDDGHHTPTSWVRAVTNCTRPTAALRTRTAAMLGDLALLASAAEAGSVGPDQLRLLARLHANDRCRPQLPDSEALLVGFAQTLTVRDFALVCQRWQAHADPDGALDDHQSSRDNRSVSSSTVGAGHRLRADGDALTGEIVNEILDAHTEAEYHNDVAERAARYGADADRYPLARTTRQRRYDALVAIFHKAAGTTDTTNRTPLVNIFCTETSLRDAIRNHYQTTTPTDRSWDAPANPHASRSTPAPGQPPNQPARDEPAAGPSHPSQPGDPPSCGDPAAGPHHPSQPGNQPARDELVADRRSHQDDPGEPGDRGKCCEPCECCGPGEPDQPGEPGDPGERSGSGDPGVPGGRRALDDPEGPADPDGPEHPLMSPRLRLSETASGAPVNPGDLVAAALIGHIRRVVIDSAGRVIDLGRRSRLYTGAARDAILLTGNRCSWPGCDLRTGTIQIDHLTGWTQPGGQTNPHNGGPACPAHNRHKHTARVTVIRDHTGWHHYRPDGTEIAPRHH